MSVGRISTVAVPRYFSCDTFKEFLNSFIPAYRSSNKIVLDFRSCDFPDLDALLLLQMYEDISKEEGKSIEYLTEDATKQKISLFRMLSLFKKEDPTFSQETFENFFSDSLLRISRSRTMEEIRQIVNKMTKIIQNQFKATKEIAMALSWCMGEITDNCATHGYENYAKNDLTLPIYTSVWGMENRVRIVIADRGQGIVNSLSKKPMYAGKGKAEILKESIKKGVSGHPDYSPGFGLYGVSEIAKNSNGKMTIMNNGLTLKIDGGVQTVTSISNFPGTFISLDLNKNSSVSLVQILGPDQIGDLDFLMEAI